MKISNAGMIEVMEKRLRKLEQRIAKERRSFPRNKSRSVRQASGIGPRIGFFQDLTVELSNTLQFLKGEKSEKEYLACQNGDDTDRLGMWIGGM